MRKEIRDGGCSLLLSTGHKAYSSAGKLHLKHNLTAGDRREEREKRKKTKHPTLKPGDYTKEGEGETSIKTAMEQGE
ncbi:hypothetical protein KI387_041764, partial [Taxus chinensis]